MPEKIILKRERALKYISLIEKWDKKKMYVSDLSQLCGIVPDVIANELAIFDPLIRLFPEYDIKLILPDMKKKYEIKKRRPSQTNIDAESYSSVIDFVYQNLTNPGGMVDKTVVLTKAQLKILRKLVNDELKK
jgi:hypothetical protein